MHNNKIKSVLILVIIFLLSFSVLFAGGKKEEAPEEAVVSESESPEAEGTAIDIDGEGIVAVVNGVNIMEEVLDRQMMQVVQGYVAQGQEIPEERFEEMKVQLLDSLIDQQLLYQNAVSKGYSVSDEVLATEMSAVKGQFGSDEEYEAALEAQGFTPEKLQKDIVLFLTVRDFLEGDFYSQITADDDKALEYYNSNVTAFTKEEQIRASHILLLFDDETDEAAKAVLYSQMEEILAKLEAGENFALVATEQSECSSSTQGGDLGLFGKGAMVDAFSDAAFALEVGEISGIVETQFGYHIIKLTEREDAGLTDFEEVKEEIKSYLSESLIREALEALIVELRESAEITIL